MARLRVGMQDGPGQTDEKIVFLRCLPGSHMCVCMPECTCVCVHVYVRVTGIWREYVKLRFKAYRCVSGSGWSENRWCVGVFFKTLY
jgi:hypothetical protein